MYVEAIAATAVRGTAVVATKPFPSPVLIRHAGSGSWSHVLHGLSQSPEIQYLAPNMSATESHLLGACSATDALTYWRSFGATTCSDECSFKLGCTKVHFRNIFLSDGMFQHKILWHEDMWQLVLVFKWLMGGAWIRSGQSVF